MAVPIALLMLPLPWAQERLPAWEGEGMQTSLKNAPGCAAVWGAAALAGRMWPPRSSMPVDGCAGCAAAGGATGAGEAAGLGMGRRPNWAAMEGSTRTSDSFLGPLGPSAGCAGRAAACN